MTNSFTSQIFISSPYLNKVCREILDKMTSYEFKYTFNDIFKLISNDSWQVTDIEEAILKLLDINETDLDEKTGLCLAINASDLDDIISDEKIDRDDLSNMLINIHEDLMNLVIEKRKEEKKEMQIFYCFQCDASIEANMIKVISQILILGSNRFIINLEIFVPAR